MTKLANEPGPLKAYELVMAFAAKRGEAALRLAMHAALPQVLRPELLHLVRLNFLPESTCDLAIEADVLFAPFCEDIGNGYYSFSANARLQLLQGLDPAYRDESMPRSVQVARFMLDYLDHEVRDIRIGSDRLRSDWIEVERWSALAFAEPALTAGQLAAALSRATVNDDVAARVRVSGLASALATPLARFGELLTYAEGVEAQQMGRADDAHRLFDTLPDREIEIAGVRLKSPRRVFAESRGKETPGGLATESVEQAGAKDEASDEHLSLVSNSPAIRSVVEKAKLVATSDASVLLLGEAGTGKEFFARAIHQWGHRAAMPFIVISCAALTERLLKNELFGHERGAFAGADQQQKGKLEMADGGTVFLNEIDEMSLSLQATLVRVLQDREFHRVGGSKTVSVNIRIIAATNKDLRQVVRSGQFREDLYFRLNVISLTIPPLRDRWEDIPALAQFFLNRHMKNEKRTELTLSTAALEALTRYPWPGNVRELDKVIARAVVLSPEDTIGPEVLGLLNRSGSEDQLTEKATPVRDQIYISCSRRDQKWWEILKSHLRSAIEDLGLSFWSSLELGPGESWEKQIAKAIGRARLVIVLVSPDYLTASGFNMRRELPQLVQLARSGNLRLVWVCVRRCDWSSSPLAEFQAAHDPHIALEALVGAKLDKVLMEIATSVEHMFRDDLGKRRETPSETPRSPKLGTIFISYRRNDSADVTGRIYDRLIQQFGREAVYLDMDSIPIGVDFRKHLDVQVAKCDVFLTVIGPQWMKTKGRRGKSRLDDPDDFMQIEIELALKRRIPVIPVLVGGASLPPAERLPVSIQGLSYRNGVVVRTGPDFHHDMDRLIEHLNWIFQGLQDRKQPGTTPETFFEGPELEQFSSAILTEAYSGSSVGTSQSFRQRNDIFIIYASEDRSRVQSLAFALEQRGWSVWWDRRIPAGRTFAEVIEEALEASKAVVVVWTQRSVVSQWVTAEAREGLNRRVLFPVLFEEVQVPLEFRAQQAAQLTDWQPDQEHDGFDQLVKAIARVVGPPSEAKVQQASLDQRKTKPFTQTGSVSGMVKVPKGPFLYGAEGDREVIDHDYWIDQYPVTNQQYGKFMRANGYVEQIYWSPEGWQWRVKRDITAPKYWSDTKWNKEDHPVVGVSYYEAEAYAKWEGKRLPTEREWEKAARGTDGREYPWGSEFDKAKCNSSKPVFGYTTPVSQYPNGVSPYGCYDMAGNVWEWCADSYGENRKHARVIRGGSWKHGSVKLSSPGEWLEQEERKKDLGFRLAQDSEP